MSVEIERLEYGLEAKTLLANDTSNFRAVYLPREAVKFWNKRIHKYLPNHICER